MSSNGANVTKFGIIDGVSPAIAEFVALEIQNATKEFIAQGGPSVVSGVPLYSNTQGKLVTSSPYSMPNTLGVAGQVLTVDAGGDIIYGSGGGGGNPFDQDLNTFNDVSFNSVTTANITGPTTVKVAGNDRLVVDATETNLYSQDVLTGPTGSFLRLKNTDEFTLGTRFSNNGALECTPNSMALIGQAAKSSIVLTDASITTSLFNGTSRVDREIMTTTGQLFRDGNLASRLQIENGIGVIVNNVYALPTTIGNAGDVMTRTGATSTTWTAPAAAPTYLPTLTVTSLSQGPSNLVQNYTFPKYAPSTDSLLGSNPAAGYTITIPALSSIRFAVERTTPFQAQVFFVPISAGTYIPTDLADALMSRIRAVLTAFNVVADIFIDFDEPTQKFSIVVIGSVTNLNVFTWSEYILGNNNNDLFGLITTPILLTAASTTPQFADSIPPTLNSSTDLVWRSVAKNQIESDNGASVIECSDLSGIISYGDYNLNNGSLNNIGNINALDVCNITTGTTQIVNGLSELNININSLPRITQDAIKTKIECGTSALNLAALSDGLSQDTTTYLAASNIGNTANISAVILPDSYNVYQNNGSIQRLIVDDTKSALYSKNALSGPTGSSLELNNDSTFTLGCYFANNGIIECRPNSLALYGNTATTAFTMTDTTITTALGVGGRIDREILDSASQTFKDNGGVERLRIDNSGVTISNDYTLPIFDGSANQVLTTDGAGTTTWQTPVALNPFDQTLNTTNDVSFNTVTTSKIDALTTLSIGGLLATSVNIGKTGITTTLKGTTSIDSLFTMPTTAGNTGDVLTKNGLGGTVWSAPQINGLYSQTAVQTVANTTVETTLIGAGVGSLSVPANYFTTGMAFRYSTGGVFRDNANNTTFRFRLRNSGVLFDSGILTLPNITVSTPWNIDVTFSYVGGTNLITNFNFQYNAGSDARGFTSQNSNNTFNTTIPNTLNFTVQWTVANANNTITTNYGVLEKIY